MFYLIMKCEPLNDQYECDANRTPISMTNDWRNWYNVNKPDYMFEVYEFINDEFKIIKDYETPMEFGMCLAYYDEDKDNFVFLKKFPNLTRKGILPEEVLERVKGKNTYSYLSRHGYIFWEEKEIPVAYTEYNDERIRPWF